MKDKQNYEPRVGMPANNVDANYPLDRLADGYQQESNVQYGYPIERNKMPTIEVTHNRDASTEAYSPSTTGVPLREQLGKGAETANMHNRFVDLSPVPADEVNQDKNPN